METFVYLEVDAVLGLLLAHPGCSLLMFQHYL